MTLTTIADLQRITPEQRNHYLQAAGRLPDLWEQWKAQDTQGYTIPVEFRGSRDRAPGVHASEVSGCARKLVYALAGTPRRVLPSQLDVNMQRRFDVGTIVHALVQYEFHAMCRWLGGSITFEDEVKIAPELGGAAQQYNMHSSCDGRFTFWYNGAPYLRVGMEIKTSSDKQFVKRRKPEKDHLEQTCVYMTALDTPLMWVLYYNKATSRFTNAVSPWLFSYDRFLWEEDLVPRILAAHTHVQQRTLPEATEGKPCDWCPWGWTCRPRWLNKSRSGSHLRLNPQGLT